MFEARVGELRRELSGTGVDAFLVNSFYNIRYLSGFNGDSGWLLITPDKSLLITDFRFLIQAKAEASGCEIVMYEGKMLDTLNELLSRERIQHLGFESEHCTYEEYQRLVSALSGIKLTGLPSLVEKLRIQKDNSEIEAIRRAVQISDAAFEHVLDFIKPGVREFEIAAEIEYWMRRKGADKPSFDTIIGSGFRGALPHGTASDRRVEKGDLIVMDFGAVYQGYCSDMTRTVVVGQASPEQRKVYDIVLKAQLAAVDALKPGTRCLDLDAVARRIIGEHGYGGNFGHGLGHGVGLEIHEAPAVNTRNGDELLQGMVVTIEPGIYLDGWGGIRIEDTVLVTADGCEVLTQSGKNLIEIA